MKMANQTPCPDPIGLAIRAGRMNDDTLIDINVLGALLSLSPGSARQAAYRSSEALPPRFPTPSRHLRFRLGDVRQWIRSRSMLPTNGDVPQAQPAPSVSDAATEYQEGKPNRLGTSTKAERVRLQRLGEQLKREQSAKGTQ